MINGIINFLAFSNLKWSVKARLVAKFKLKFIVFTCWRLWAKKKKKCLVTLFNKDCLSHSSLECLNTVVWEHFNGFLNYQVTVLSSIVVIILKIVRTIWCCQHIKNTFLNFFFFYKYSKKSGNIRTWNILFHYTF